MFWYCCSQSSPQIENVFEKDLDNLRVRLDTHNKQINNIYELLETLTNESKAKNILEHFNNNNVQQKDNSEPTTTSVI